MTVSERRRRDDSGEENEERWLVTYADMITLLMAFFIMMYAMSVVDLKKFEQLADAMGHVFGAKAGGAVERGTGSEVLEGGQGLLSGSRSLVGNSSTLVNRVNRAIDRSLSEDLRGCVHVSQRDGLVTVSIAADGLTFERGEAKLTAEARQILDAVAPSLLETQAQVLVEGHTCDLPINTARFPSNWELSAERATNVMVYLIRRAEIWPGSVAAVAYADTRPVAPNDSEQHRARNRRVDIVVLPGRAAEISTAGTGRSKTRPSSVPATPIARPQEDADEDTDLRLPEIRLVPPIDVRHYRSDTRGSRGRTAWADVSDARGMLEARARSAERR